MKKVCMLLKRSRSMLEKDSRVLRESKALADAGYEVVILIYDTEDKEDFVIDGVIVKTVKIAGLKLLLKYNSFSDNITGKYQLSFIQKAFRKIYFFYLNRVYLNNTLKKALSLKYDIYHCHDFETLEIGYRVKKILPIKIAYDAHELWLENRNYLSTNFILSLLRKCLKQVNILKERIWIKDVDLVITVNQSLAQYLSDFYNIKKPVILRNLPDQIKITNNGNKFRQELNIHENTNIVLYQGALLSGRGIENLIKAFENINNNTILVFMGYGALYDYVKNISQLIEFNDKIFLKDAVSPSDLLGYTCGADLGVSLIENTCKSYYYSSPNKVWEYIAAGVPILVSDFPEMRQSAIDEQMGYTVDPASPEDISKKINSIFDKKNYSDYLMRKNNCIEKTISQYNWEKEKEILISAYQSM
ncbi:glycosyltransferase [Desulfobacterium sp. N47]